jgi:hypothetical protein
MDRIAPSPAYSATRLATLLAILLISGVLSIGCSSALRTTVEFSRDEIQGRIEKKFPFTEKNAFFALTFSAPQVLLERGDRMGLEVDVKAALLGGASYDGHLEVDGRLDYRPEEGAIFLADTRLERFELEGVSTSYLEQIEAVVGSVLKGFLISQPIYQLRQGDFKHSLAKLALKSVRVENGKVVAEVGL